MADKENFDWDARVQQTLVSVKTFFDEMRDILDAGVLEARIEGMGWAATACEHYCTKAMEAEPLPERLKAIAAADLAKEIRAHITDVRTVLAKLETKMQGDT